MKALLTTGLAVALTARALAQDTSSSAPESLAVGADTAAVSGTELAVPRVDGPAVITERGPHYQLLTSITARTNGNRLIYQTNVIREIGSGLNVKNATGKYVPARAEIHLTENGAECVDTQHKVYFQPDINGSPAGAVSILSPDGTRLQTRFLCLAYADPGGKSVVIAELTNSIGVLSAPNEVTYRSALTDVRANLRYTVRREGIEADCVLLECPEPPSAYGLSDKARLEIWSEWFGDFEPVISKAGRSDSPGEMFDARIKIGSMSFAPGAAFANADENSEEKALIATHRNWVVAENRRFLVEDLEWSRAAAALKKLGPPRQASLTPTPGSVRHVVSTKRLLPSPKPVAGKTKPQSITVAAVDKTEGFTIDFNLITPMSGLRMQSDMTYLLPSNSLAYCEDTTIIEGGAVLKGQYGATLFPLDPVECRTTLAHPAIFTSVFDCSVGEVISNGPPIAGWSWAGIALGSPSELKYLHFKDTTHGIVSYLTSFTVSHCQFSHCQNALWIENVTASVRNSLFYDVTNVFYGYGFTAVGDHLTVDHAQNLTFDFNAGEEESYSTASLTNSILYDVVSLGNVPVETNATYVGAAGAPVFATGGGGYHYIRDDSPSRALTPAPSESSLLLELSGMSTYPPQILACTNLGAQSLTFSMRAPRGGASPTVGYHYPAVDYAFGGVTMTNAATLTLSEGTVVATFGTNGIMRGLTLANGAALRAEGTASEPVRFVEYNAVDEENPPGWTNCLYCMVTDDLYENGTSTPASFDLRFTEFSSMGQDLAELGAVTSPVVARHCQFHGGVTVAYASAAVTNCLFERAFVAFDTPTNSMLSVQNALFYGAYAQFSPHALTNQVIADSLFDKTALSMNDWVYQGGHNATVTNHDRIWPLRTNDIILADTDFVTGPLGYFYYPTNGGNLSRLINAGTTNANAVGLYHFSTTTNLIVGTEIKETNSVVDVGFHVPALTSAGLLVDSDSDGLADLAEDVSGDGLYNPPGETSWLSADSDSDGVSDPTELLQGRNPNAAGTVSDTNNLIKLQVYTPLH